MLSDTTCDFFHLQQLTRAQLPLDVALLSQGLKIINVTFSREALTSCELLPTMGSHIFRCKQTHQRADEAKKPSTLLAGRNLGQNPALTKGPPG